MCRYLLQNIVEKGTQKAHGLFPETSNFYVLSPQAPTPAPALLSSVLSLHIPQSELLPPHCHPFTSTGTSCYPPSLLSHYPPLHFTSSQSLCPLCVSSSSFLQYCDLILLLYLFVHVFIHLLIKLFKKRHKCESKTINLYYINGACKGRDGKCTLSSNLCIIQLFNVYQFVIIN